MIVGISTPALYRHFPTKYALFAEATGLLADALTAALETSASDLESALTALAQSAIDHRRTGGLYRWDQRYLDGDDATKVKTVLVNQHRRIRAALLDTRPSIPRPHADLLVAAMISVVASPTTHRTTLADRDIRRLLVTSALSLADIVQTGVTDSPDHPRSAGWHRLPNANSYSPNRSRCSPPKASETSRSTRSLLLQAFPHPASTATSRARPRSSRQHSGELPTASAPPIPTHLRPRRPIAPRSSRSSHGMSDSSCTTTHF